MSLGGRRNIARRWLLTVAAAAGLAACGGPTLGPASRLTSPVGVDQGQASAWVSTYRKDHGLSPVVQDAALQAVAQAQADAMAAANALSHTVAGSLPRRLARLDRDKGASAENVSAGYPDLDAALGGWRRSPEHNANLLFAPMRRIGVAGARAPDTRYKTFWAMVMTD